MAARRSRSGRRSLHKPTAQLLEYASELSALAAHLQVVLDVGSTSDIRALIGAIDEMGARTVLAAGSIADWATLRDAVRGKKRKATKTLVIPPITDFH